MEDIAYLVKKELTGRDDEGNPVYTRTKRRVFCDVKSVTRNEFYSAGVDGITPEIEMTISHRIDYEEEPLVYFAGQPFNVLRVYWNGDAVTLTLGRKTGEESEVSA